jgi:hypothetical protein
MRLTNVRFTIRWLIRIAVFAAGFAFLLAAGRAGIANRCGTPLLEASAFLAALATGYVVIRTMIFDIRHTS